MNPLTENLIITGNLGIDGRLVDNDYPTLYPTKAEMNSLKKKLKAKVDLAADLGEKLQAKQFIPNKIKDSAPDYTKCEPRSGGVTMVNEPYASLQQNNTKERGGAMNGTKATVRQQYTDQNMWNEITEDKGKAEAEVTYAQMCERCKKTSMLSREFEEGNQCENKENLPKKDSMISPTAHSHSTEPDKGDKSNNMIQKNSSYTKKDEQKDTIKEKTAGGQDDYCLKAEEDSADRASIASIGYVPRDREHTHNKDLIRKDFGDSVAAITVQYIHSNLSSTIPRWMSSKEMNTEDTYYNTIERKFHNRQKQIEQR